MASGIKCWLPLFGMAQSVLRLTSILVVFAMFSISPLAWAQGGVDLSNLDDQTRKQIKAACYFYKLEGGPAYSKCLKKEAGKRNASVNWSTPSSRSKASALPTVLWKEDAQNKSASWGERPSASKLFKQVEQSVYMILAADSEENLEAGEEVTQGSAVAISQSLVLTNCHVIEDAKAIVLISEDTHYPATFRAIGKAEDSCVLEVEGVLNPFQRFADIAVWKSVKPFIRLALRLVYPTRSVRVSYLVSASPTLPIMFRPQRRYPQDHREVVFLMPRATWLGLRRFI